MNFMKMIILTASVDTAFANDYDSIGISKQIASLRRRLTFTSSVRYTKLGDDSTYFESGSTCREGTAELTMTELPQGNCSGVPADTEISAVKYRKLDDDSPLREDNKDHTNQLQYDRAGYLIMPKDRTNTNISASIELETQSEPSARSEQSKPTSEENQSKKTPYWNNSFFMGLSVFGSGVCAVVGSMLYLVIADENSSSGWIFFSPMIMFLPWVVKFFMWSPDGEKKTALGVWAGITMGCITVAGTGWIHLSANDGVRLVEFGPGLLVITTILSSVVMFVLLAMQVYWLRKAGKLKLCASFRKFFSKS